MWEIEALMERTVRLIDKSNFSENKKRNLIWNTYNLQNQFDCSFTHFRVIDILKKYNFVQKFNIQEFPLHVKYPIFFENLIKKNFEWINNNPLESWSEDNQEIAYWDKVEGAIFVDYGSKYYNLEKDYPSELPPLDFALVIINEADKQQAKEIIYDWTSFAVLYIMAWFPPNSSFKELTTKYFNDIKNIFKKYNYNDYKAIHKGLDILNLDQGWIEDMSENQKQLIKLLTQ